MATKLKVSLATIYNTLNQFTASGLLREVVVEPGRSYFDTNMSEHHHFYEAKTGVLEDIAGDQVALIQAPVPPPGKRISRIAVIIELDDE